MLNIVVASVVAQVLHGNPRPDEVGKGEPLLDDLVLRWRRGISAVDDVEVILGEQVQLSDQLLGLNRRQIGARELQNVVEFGGRESKQEEKSE